MSYTKNINFFYFSNTFNKLYSEFFINKFLWKIDPIFNNPWKLDKLVTIAKVQEIRAVRFWEKFRQGTNREQYRTGVHMIIYLNLVLFLASYLKFNSSSINLSKLSITTTLVCIILFFSVRKFLTITTFYHYYDRLNSLKFF